MDAAQKLISNNLTWAEYKNLYIAMGVGALLAAAGMARLLIWKARKKPAPAPNTEEQEEGK